MKNRLFLCVDGGGTKTEALLVSTDGRALGRGIAGGSNALSVWKKQAISAVTEAIQAAVVTRDFADIHSLHLFIPGFSSCLPLPFPLETRLYSDSVNAYFGALAKPGGIVLLAGTGSFAVSFDENGHETSVGGWGPLLGDEGSGFDIGKRAVIHTLSVRDTGCAPSRLGRAVLAHYGVEDDKLLIRAIYHGNCDRKQLAGLCKIVGELAHAGDADALAILKQAADALCSLAVQLKKRLQLSCVPVALLGGVSLIGDPIKRPLEDALCREGLILQEPLYAPVVGGAVYAHRQITGNFPSDDTAQKYHETYLKLVKEKESV